MMKHVLFGLTAILLMLICISACNVANKTETSSSQSSMPPTESSEPIKSSAIDHTNTIPITTIPSETTPVMTTTVNDPPKTTTASQTDPQLTTTKAPVTTPVPVTTTKDPVTAPVPVTTTKDPETTPVPVTTPAPPVTTPASVTTPAPPESSLQIGDNDNNADWGPLIPMVTTNVG